MSKWKEYTRQELYELVWATPMVKLAKEFGLSDVRLRKTCVKHDIPTPPLGYCNSKLRAMRTRSPRAKDRLALFLWWHFRKIRTVEVGFKAARFFPIAGT